MRISEYLYRTGKSLAFICDFDDNGNEYNHVFYLCDEGEAENEAWKLEIKKMENITLGEIDEEGAINLGLNNIEDCYNYVAI